MSLTLLITDNADGTGGVATIAGSAVGSTNALYLARFTGAMGTPAWNSVGSRTGDGTIAAAPGNGFYLWYLDSLSDGSHAISNVAYQNLTDATQSVHYRCLLAAQAVIQTLAIVPTANVLVGWVPKLNTRLDPMPAVGVNPYGRENQLGVLTGRDDVGYPVMLTLFDSQAQSNQENLARDLLWRQKAFRAFRNQRLAGVPEVINADVVPDPVVDMSTFQKNFFVSSLLVNFRSREPRGLS